MTSFMEDLINSKYDFNQEILSIDILLHESNSTSYGTLYDMISENFRSWKHRRNCISLKQFFISTGITTILEKAENSLCNLDDFCCYAECIINLLSFTVDNTINGRYLFNDKLYIIFSNINNILESSNLELRYLKEKQYYIIMPKKWKINKAIDIIKTEYDLGEKILIYSSKTMKGKLFEKSDILCRFYKIFEKDYIKKLKSNNYTNLASDIGFLSEKLDVRHAPNKKEKMVLDKMPLKILENWYDKLFDLYLDMLILCEHIDINTEIQKLKKEL